VAIHRLRLLSSFSRGRKLAFREMRLSGSAGPSLDARVDAGAVLTQEFLLGFVAGADFSLPYVSALSALSVVLRLDQPY